MDVDNLSELYIDYLMVVSGQATATGLSAVTDYRVSHDRVTRTLSSGCFDERALWKAAKTLCHEVACDDSVLIVDDSIEAKPYSKTNGLISWHFDHTVGRSVKGVSFLTALYHSKEMSIPVGVRFVDKDCTVRNLRTGKQRQVASVSKNEHFRQLVGMAANNIRTGHVLSDSWFCASENMAFMQDIGLKFILAMKDNRKVALSLEDKRMGRYVSIKEAGAEGRVVQVYVQQLDFPLLVTGQVFKNGDEIAGTLYLCSNDLELSYDRMTTIYKKRWKVEEYHKSIKSNTSFPSSPTSTIRTQKAHFIASIMAHNRLEIIKVRSGHNHFALRRLVQINATKTAWNTFQQLKSNKSNRAA